MPTLPPWWRTALAGILFAVALIGGIFLLPRFWQTEETLVTIAPLSTESGTVTVYVGGAVARPGLYTLPSGERIEAALLAAGGLAEDANPDGLNRAARLRDEAQIVVPRKGEPTIPPAQLVVGSPVPQQIQPTITTGSKASPTVAATGPINVNTATANELAQLPGVGPKLAQAIIDYRLEHGPFTGPADLAKVQGISERMAFG
jgi:competence protein ComEA